MREASVAGILCVSLVLCSPATAAERRDINFTKSTIVRAQPSPRVVRISAERFAFTPSEITVETGTIVEFHLTSEDTDHGFRIIGTEVDVQIPKRRRGETVVRYTADQAGRFIIECSRPCGAGHTAMRATLIVK